MSNVLSKISDAIFHPSSGNSGVVGVDFSSSAIKVVQIRRKDNSPVLQTYGELSYASYTDKVVGESVDATPDILQTALKDLLREAKVTTETAGIAIPLSASLINIIDLPTGTNEQDLDEVIPMEARKYIPTNPDEVLLDWTLVGKGANNDGHMKALVVAIQKNAISQYQHALSQVDIDPGFFEIEVFSTIRSTLDQGIEPVMLVDIGTSATKVYIVEHGVVRGSHRIEQGGEDITRTLASNLGIDFAEAEKVKRKVGLTGDGDDAEAVKESAHNVLDHVFSRAEEIVSAYQEENATVVQEAVLTGGGAVLSGIEAVANDLIGVAVNRADPFGKLQSPDFLEQTLKDIGPEFAVAIGAALRRLRET